MKLGRKRKKRKKHPQKNEMGEEEEEELAMWQVDIEIAHTFFSPHKKKIKKMKISNCNHEQNCRIA